MMAIQKYDIRRPQAAGGSFEERYWSPINSPVFSPSHEVIYLIHRVEDVTEYMHLRAQEQEHARQSQEWHLRVEQMEAEIYLRGQQLQEVNRQLQRAAEELERRVAERTTALAQANADLRVQVAERIRAEEQVRQVSQRVLEAQEVERRRVARELHDEIGQALTGVKLLLELAGGANGTWAEPAVQLGEIHSAIDDALARVRELSLGLRPAMLDTLGLLPAERWQIERFQTQTGIAVMVHLPTRMRRLPPDLETGMYRLLQEALTNIARHAEAPRAWVSVRRTRQALTLRVEDHGRGFDVEATVARGVTTGLAGMRERVALLGGALEVTSTPGAGTIIAATLPVHRRHEAVAITPGRRQRSRA